MTYKTVVIKNIVVPVQEKTDNGNRPMNIEDFHI